MARSGPKWRLWTPDVGRAMTLVDDVRGAVYTEYILIVMLIGLIVSAALIAIGVPIWRAFRMTQLFLGAPLP
jgi:Flp pilus assembly pilin Flp